MSSGRELQIKVSRKKKVHVTKQLAFVQSIIFCILHPCYFQCRWSSSITECIVDNRNACHIGIQRNVRVINDQ